MNPPRLVELSAGSRSGMCVARSEQAPPACAPPPGPTGPRTPT